MRLFLTYWTSRKGRKDAKEWGGSRQSLCSSLRDSVRTVAAVCDRRPSVEFRGRRSQSATTADFFNGLLAVGTARDSVRPLTSPQYLAFLCVLADFA